MVKCKGEGCKKKSVEVKYFTSLATLAEAISLVGDFKVLLMQMAL